MAYPKHYLMQFGGFLYGSEIWSNSLRFGSTVHNPGGLDFEQILDDLVSDLRFHYLGTNAQTTTTIEYVKFNEIDEQGRYADQTKTNERRLAGSTGATAVIRGTGAAKTPPQLSAAVSLHTARQRGVGSRGRFYPPAPTWANQVESDGRLSEATVAPFGQAMADMLTAFGNWPGFDPLDSPWVAVVSPGGRSSLEGVKERVTGVSVGRVVDTIRRRRNELREDPAAILAVT